MTVHRRLTFVPVLALMSLVLVGCSSGPSNAPVHGSVAVTYYEDETAAAVSDEATGDDCVSTTDYSDVAAGTEVDILDNSGKVLGVGQLRGGSLLQGDGPSHCVFKFTVEDVPQGESIYGVRLADGNRGTVHVKSSELFGPGPRLTVG